MHSSALEKNKLGDSAEQDVSIYLPPSYSSAVGRRFAAVYLLHGLLDAPAVWTDGGFQGMKLQETMDRLIAEGLVHEMIVVVPNGRNAYFGSLYANSSVTGNWEDYIAHDVVGYVDAHYRTIPEASSRGIAGHSMGGYGALMLAIKHPEIFSAVYALSPCCVGMKADLTSANHFWHAAVAVKTSQQLYPSPTKAEEFYVDAFVALAAAFSPDPERAPLFVDFPYREENRSLVANESALRQWEARTPLEAAPLYKDNLLRLHGIYLDYGLEENFPHIPLTLRLFSEELAQLGVPHVLAAYHGTHDDHIRERFENVLLPFFSHQLSAGKD